MTADRSLVLAGLLAACSPAAPPQRPPALHAQFGVLDSARVDSLCMEPDSVRAGRKPCVLRDQSPPPPLRIPAPPPPPRR